jgi:chromate reductase
VDRSDRVRIVGISGSVRRLSSNSALIQAAARLAPAGCDVTVFDALGGIPPFDPDHDDESPPEPVASFRRMLIACDAVVIASPEYAHGVPGVLKNALDWVVGSGELVGKPIALFNASSRATHAWASLLEILTTMSACVIREASLTIPLQGRTWDPSDIVEDVERSTLVRSAMEALAAAVHGAQLTSHVRSEGSHAGHERVGV